MTAAETIDHLASQIERLVAERQDLRASAADPLELEHNRLALGALQRRLAAALIARYLPSAA